MKCRLSVALAGIITLLALGSLGGCGEACTQDELNACKRVESGEPAAKVFGAMNPTILRGKLERCVVCADGPGVRKSLEAAKTIESVLKNLKK